MDHRPFRPLAARVVCWSLVVLVTAGAVVLLVVLPVVTAGRHSWPDRIEITVLATAIVWFLVRQARVRAVPDETGLSVHNLVVRRRLEWGQIVSVRFGQGRPWVQLDLADGTTLAVMGVQAADGARADAEAKRLATLVALHSVTPRDD